MENDAKVLQLMAEAGKPVSAGLKEQGKIVSPVRCKWQPA